METHVAKHKPHRCDICGKRIPIGARYFSEDGGVVREHTSCVQYDNEPLLEIGFNQDRSVGEVWYTADYEMTTEGQSLL